MADSVLIFHIPTCSLPKMYWDIGEPKVNQGQLGWYRGEGHSPRYQWGLSAGTETVNTPTHTLIIDRLCKTTDG